MEGRRHFAQINTRLVAVSSSRPEDLMHLNCTFWPLGSCLTWRIEIEMLSSNFPNLIERSCAPNLQQQEFEHHFCFGIVETNQPVSKIEHYIFVKMKSTAHYGLRMRYLHTVFRRNLDLQTQLPVKVHSWMGRETWNVSITRDGLSYCEYCTWNILTSYWIEKDCISAPLIWVFTDFNQSYRWGRMQLIDDILTAWNWMERIYKFNNDKPLIIPEKYRCFKTFCTVHNNNSPILNQFKKLCRVSDSLFVVCYIFKSTP